MPKVIIPEWCGYSKQMCQLGNHHWSVSRLVELTKDFEVFTVPLVCLNLNIMYDSMSLRGMIMHMNAVSSADLQHPIILDEDGELMDGRHRIMKALSEGLEEIKAVRFDLNPPPCKTGKKNG
ncbi:MAG: hypothetical protein GY774_04940 [Planctomycetes bacterium]|nr:hypothetical protein [Planctomycetota bacterium]